MTRVGPGSRVVLADLADVLIPAGRGFPCARAAGVASGGLDAVLAVRPEIEAPLMELLERAEGRSRHAFLDSLSSTDPSGFDLLTFVVAAGYFSNHDVRRRLAYPGRTAQPLREPAAGVDWERALLEPVRRRGRVYRLAP